MSDMQKLETGYLYRNEGHIWFVKGPLGGVHIRALENPLSHRYERYIGGIEMHSARRPDWAGEKPHHEECWLLAGPCWHDGSSLQFSEQIAPFLEDLKDVREADDYIFSIAKSKYRDWFVDDWETE